MDSLDAEFAAAFMGGDTDAGMPIGGVADADADANADADADADGGAARPIARREVFVTHDAFGRMCGAYGLTQVAAVGLSPDAEPDPARMAEIIRLAKEHGATTVFYEDNGSPRIAQAIAESIGGKAAALSPVEALGEDELSAGADYFTKMRGNLAALLEALR